MLGQAGLHAGQRARQGMPCARIACLHRTRVQLAMAQFLQCAFRFVSCCSLRDLYVYASVLCAGLLG